MNDLRAIDASRSQSRLNPFFYFSFILFFLVMVWIFLYSLSFFLFFFFFFFLFLCPTNNPSVPLNSARVPANVKAKWEEKWISFSIYARHLTCSSYHKCAPVWRSLFWVITPPLSSIKLPGLLGSRQSADFFIFSVQWIGNGRLGWFSKCDRYNGSSKTIWIWVKLVSGV